jgi:hypothetical protein
VVCVLVLAYHMLGKTKGHHKSSVRIRLYRIFRLCPSSSILSNTKLHNFSERESLSVLR